jgi:carbon storage regulator
MLILNRRPGDAILIDGGIRIVVLASDNGGVRIGIEAPEQVGIFREELVDSIAEENRRAGAGTEARAWLREVAGRRGGGDGGAEEGTPDEAADPEAG